MYKSILVPVDLGDKHSWRKAIPTAVTLCETFDAALVVMTVNPAIDIPVVGQLLPQDFETRVKRHSAQQLKAFVSVQVPPGIEVQRIIATGKVYQEIIHAAVEIGADLIIMGSGRPELKDYHLGSNAARVARHAQGSVMVVRD
jgi:nucleotide-binding universal stress UspA family protein